MIVDGLQEFVGGDSSKAREAIMKAARLPKAKVQLLVASNSNGTNRDLKLSIHISDIPRSPLATRPTCCWRLLKATFALTWRAVKMPDAT
jgi:hypothetical protein